jgi:hypothetical protein
MNTRTVSACGGLAFLAVTALAGCGQEGAVTQASATARTGSESIASGARGQDVLRVRTDAARNRRWELAVDDVRIYDASKKTLIRQIALPNWSVAKLVCMPDFALDPSGAAYIVSNVQPKLWRIDADSFAVSEHQIGLQGKERWDIGFGAVAFTSGGALYALTSTANSAWKIDLAKGSASAIEFYSPPMKPCALTKEFLNRIERTGARQKAAPDAAGPG